MSIFNPVEVIKPFLGIDKGTILKFDSASGKYVSMSKEEDISDDSYYYSGHAIAIDPTIIKSNLNKSFKLLSKTDEDETRSEVKEERDKEIQVKPVTASKVKVNEEKKADLQPEPKVETETLPRDRFNLVFECGLCHTVNVITEENNGLFLPASKFTSVKMECENCGIETKLYFDELS